MQTPRPATSIEGADPLRPILLVEDNPMDIDLTRRAFAKRRLATPIDVARDGEEALARLAEWAAGKPQPVVILLDLNLPKVSGLEVLQALKSHAVYKRIPVVVFTTSKEDADVNSAYALGANSYIVKPVDFVRFTELAEQVQMYWSDLNTPGSE
jgi:CheY-like chemotaxis protein